MLRTIDTDRADAHAKSGHDTAIMGSMTANWMAQRTSRVPGVANLRSAPEACRVAPEAASQKMGPSSSRNDRGDSRAVSEDANSASRFRTEVVCAAHNRASSMTTSHTTTSATGNHKKMRYAK
jgi:hypothetical protein